MSGGSISGNTATNSYGGLRVNGSGTINMTGGSVSGNTATNHGGIYVNGTLNMTGGSVTGNNATNNYGGIYVNGTLNMSGLPIVMGNLVTPTNGTETTSNVYLPSGKTITVNGAFTTGANIGITCADGENTTFTSGFGTNSPNNLAVFTSDNLSYIVTVLGNEAKLVDYNAPTISDHNVPYLNVLEDGDHGTAYRELCMKMSSVSTDNPILTQDNASGGWYVLDQNCNFNKRISIQDGDTVNLIITEYLALNANKGIDVPAGATLHIWGQSDPLLPTAATGVINSFAQENGDPGIGGSGYLYIHGGVICAIGGKNAAGIKGKSVNGQGIYGLYIYGGAVVSIGGEHGAGIGCGFSQVCGGIKITGGQVYAKGNYRAAGIGAGYHSWTCTPPSGSFSGNPSDDEFAEIRITGGDVTVIGGTGAGIGGGQAWDDWEGTPAIVYIDGGKVYASTEDGQPTNSDGAVAIGKGSRGMDIYYYLHIYDGAKVSASTSNNGGLTLQSAADGRSNSKYTTFKQMTIEPCDHPNGNHYTDNDSCLYVCNHCYTTEPYTFQSAGNWDDASKWLGNFTPGNGNNVAVKAAATIPNGCIANVGNIDMQEGGSLTIADGGQLLHTNAVPGTIQKHITGYGETSNPGGWYLIGAPILIDSALVVNSGMVDLTNGDIDFTTHGIDLYDFDQSNELEWKNMRTGNRIHLMGLHVNHAYLYARANDATLNFSTTDDQLFAPTSEDKLITLVRDIYGADFAGWNLISNPFTCNAYFASGRDFCRMNATGDAIVLATADNGGNAIKPCEGVFVVVGENDPETTLSNPVTGITISANIAMTTTEPEPSGSKGLLDITVKQGGLLADVARVRFGDGDRTSKLVLDENATRLSITQDGKDYSVVSSENQGEMPVSFKAKANGTYTISVNPEDVEVNYLHLIDNMTGADVDLLATPSYTFEAKTSDYASRFRLVFSSICGDADGDNEIFAFISNGNIIVNGEGTLQVIDMLGHVLYTAEANSSFIIHHSSFPFGVYVLRLINGDDVKTQKIVID